jgi:hypothetical protein
LGYKKRIAYAFGGLIFTAALYCSTMPALADTSGKLIGDESDGSRSNTVHKINLLDEEGQKIALDDEPLLPFSTRQTCGACHSYDKIAKGWHFNAVQSEVAPGRIGQAWIYVDRATPRLLRADLPRPAALPKICLICTTPLCRLL